MPWRTWVSQLEATAAQRSCLKGIHSWEGRLFSINRILLQRLMPLCCALWVREWLSGSDGAVSYLCWMIMAPEFILAALLIIVIPCGAIEGLTDMWRKSPQGEFGWLMKHSSGTRLYLLIPHGSASRLIGISSETWPFINPNGMTKSFAHN